MVYIEREFTVEQFYHYINIQQYQNLDIKISIVTYSLVLRRLLLKHNDLNSYLRLETVILFKDLLLTN